MEDRQGERLPLVSAELLYEIIDGVARIIEDAVYGKSRALEGTYGWRRHFERKEKYRDWIMVRAQSDGWKKSEDRLEILWGPDYQGRHDFIVFRGGRIGINFSVIPDGHGLPVRDKRVEIDAFDVEEGLKSIGVTRRAPSLP